MAKKTNRRLGLNRETLRRLTDNDLSLVAGGYASSKICEAANESGRCGSTTEGYHIIGYDVYGKAIYSYSG